MAKRTNYNGPRQPNGQPSRAKNPNAAKNTPEPIDELALTVRARKQAEMWGVRMVDAKSKSTIRDEKRGDYIGILRMIGIQSKGVEGISDNQYQAGVKAQYIRENYLCAIGDVEAKKRRRAKEGLASVLTHDEEAERDAKSKAMWADLVRCVQDLERQTGQVFYMSVLDQAVFESNSIGFTVGDIRCLLNAVYNRFMAAQKAKRAA